MSAVPQRPLGNNSQTLSGESGGDISPPRDRVDRQTSEEPDELSRRRLDNPPQPSATSGDLAAMIADLEGYIERRATEIAAPRIRAVEEQAAADVAAARFQVDLKEDVIAEQIRLLDARERALTKWREATGARNWDDRRIREAFPPPVPAAEGVADE